MTTVAIETVDHPQESVSAVEEPQIPAKLHAAEAAIDFAGGVAGGVASVYVGQPLDTVKVKLQTFPTLYRNALDCFVQTYRQEGIVRGLYAGTLPSIAAQVAENSVLFMCYGMCQRTVQIVLGKAKDDELNVFGKATAGAVAAFFSSFTLCPTELIKCKLQAMQQMVSTGHLPPTTHIGPLSLTHQVLREEGIRGLFRGLVPTFAREIPGYFFFFGGYELSKEFMTPAGKQPGDIGPFKTILCGGIGGLSLWIAVFPADLIKSRVQVQSQDGPKRNFFSMLVHITRQEGLAALYKGLGPTLLRTFPATGMLFLAYETTKKLLTDLVS